MYEEQVYGVFDYKVMFLTYTDIELQKSSFWLLFIFWRPYESSSIVTVSFWEFFLGKSWLQHFQKHRIFQFVQGSARAYCDELQDIFLKKQGS